MGTPQLKDYYLYELELTEVLAHTFHLLNEYNHISLQRNRLATIEYSSFVLPAITGELYLCQILPK